MKKNDRLTSWFAGLWVTAPLLGLMYLAYHLAGLPYTPFDLVYLLSNQLLNGWSPWAGQLAATLLFGLVAAALAMWAQALGKIEGLFFALFLIALGWLARSIQTAPLGSFVAILWLALLGWTWGWGVSRRYGYQRVGDGAVAEHGLSRRQFLGQAGAVVATAVTAGLGVFLSRSRRTFLVMEQQLWSVLPPTLRVRLYPVTPNFQFPEMVQERFRPDKRPFGVCISGGGTRALACAIGQLRGLTELGFWDHIGCLSAVSGGALASLVFSYAPSTIADENLLGVYQEPATLTLADVTQAHPQSLAAIILNLTNANFTAQGIELAADAQFSTLQGADRVFARTINNLVLKPFQLDEENRFFTLDEAFMADIMARNPSLNRQHFYPMRPNRPYPIIGATHVYPLGQAAQMRHVEYSPLYCGTQQYFPGIGPENTDFGGGYVETMAFDSLTPAQPPDTDNIVTIPTPRPLFLLSDVLGSTAAAVGILLNQQNAPDWLPVFNYWPLTQAGQVPAIRQSFTDGGALENMGIVPLLRRQYPVILVFVNAIHRLGEPHPMAVTGVTGQISQLFGIDPAETLGIQRNIHIFPTEKYTPLVAGLLAAQAQGRGAFFVDSYPIVQPNPFDLAPYPGHGEVTVMWFYNNLNANWRAQLSQELQALLQSSEPTNNFASFPYYETFGHNQNSGGLAELFYLSPEQINLVSHMWSYTLVHDAKDTLAKLRQQFAPGND